MTNRIQECAHEIKARIVEDCRIGGSWYPGRFDEADIREVLEKYFASEEKGQRPVLADTGQPEPAQPQTRTRSFSQPLE